MNSIAIALHVIAAAVWVGGMFFVLVVFRPAMQALDPEPRLQAMAITLRKFFPWVWMAILILLGTGYYLVESVFGGFGSVSTHIHIMHGLAWIMVILFAVMYFGPNKKLRAAAASSDAPTAVASLGKIRTIVMINFVLGLVVIAVASGGRYF